MKYSIDASVAQLDRASDFGSEGWGFESFRAHQKKVMKIYKPFGPTIGKTKLSSRIVDSLNKFSESVSRNKKLSKKYDYDHQLIGSMKQQFRIPTKVLKTGIERQIINSIKDYYKKTLNIKVKKIKIERAWIVSQYAGDFNPPHLHRGNISGCLLYTSPSPRD